MKTILFLLFMVGCWGDPDIDPCGTVTETGTTTYGNQWVIICGERYLVYDTSLVVNIGDYICVDSLGHQLRNLDQ